MSSIRFTKVQKRAIALVASRGAAGINISTFDKLIEVVTPYRVRDALCQRGVFRELHGRLYFRGPTDVR